MLHDRPAVPLLPSRGCDILGRGGPAPKRGIALTRLVVPGLRRVTALPRHGYSVSRAKRQPASHVRKRRPAAQSRTRSSSSATADAPAEAGASYAWMGRVRPRRRSCAASGCEARVRCRQPSPRGRARRWRRCRRRPSRSRRSRSRPAPSWASSAACTAVRLVRGDRAAAGVLRQDLLDRRGPRGGGGEGGNRGCQCQDPTNALISVLHEISSHRGPRSAIRCAGSSIQAANIPLQPVATR